MAQIPNLQSTNTLGVDDQAILRQGTIDKRIGLNLAGILSWARRNGYNHLGEHTTGVQFPDTESFTTFQGKTYFVNEDVTLPYTATSNDPSTDTNLNRKDDLFLNTKRYRTFNTISDIKGDKVGDRISVENYSSGSDSGILFFTVVPAGTGVDDGGKFITLPSGNQLEQNLKKPYNIQAWGASPNASAADNDIAIAACISFASTQEYVVIPDKVDQVKGNVYAPSGRYFATKIDVVDGILPEGDSPTSTVFIDQGTDTSRAFVEVGSSGREYNRCGLSKIGLLGAKLANRNGIRFTKTYRMSGLFDCAVDDFYNNVVGEDFFAAAFVNNRIYSAINNNFDITNGTSTYWENNRIELAGLHNVAIDGESSQEPISLSFNGDKLQSCGGSAIHGVDVLSVELNSVFIESNNQLGGFNHVNFIGGTSSNERGTISISGGLITPGSGQTDSTALNIGNMKTVSLMPIFIRGGFDEGLRLGTDVENAIIFGEIDGPVSRLEIPTNVNYISALRGDDIHINGFQAQKMLNRIRETSSNTDSQSIDKVMLLNTGSNNVIYTVMTADFADHGRTIDLQKITGDSNLILVRTEGSQTVNGATEYSTSEAFARRVITIVDDTRCFVG